jgi:hypothetical protein
MRSLSAWELLTLWEQGAAQSTSARALALLSACGEGPPERVEHLPIGRRDALLLELRDRTFGSLVECVATCPRCREAVEVAFRIADVVVPAAPGPPECGRLETGGGPIAFRLPNSADLSAIARAADVADARRQLLARCLLSAPPDLPDEIVRGVEEEMARLDPQANVQLALACPHCDHNWEAGLDIAAVFWTEIAAWAQRMFREVHALASAYGWSERDILGMSAWRRQMYLGLVTG